MAASAAALGAYQQQWPLAADPQQALQQFAGGRIEPVMVFDDQAQRTLRDQIFQPQQQGVDHLPPDFLWRLRLGCGRRVLAEQQFQPVDDVLSAGPGAQPALKPVAYVLGLIAVIQAEPARQQVNHRSKRAVSRFRAAGQDSHATATGRQTRPEFPHQPGFSDAGLAHNQQRGELAQTRLLPGGLQQREFALAANPGRIVCLAAGVFLAARLTQ